MTRTVFGSHSEVCHVWAQNSQEEGRSDGRVFFEGPALYSYGRHFMLGFILPDGVALLNADSYSVSTGKHKSHAWSAVSHRESYNLPSLTALRDPLKRIAEAQGDSRIKGGQTLAWARSEIRAWAVDHIASGDLNPSYAGFTYLLRIAGLSRSWAAICREGEKLARRRAEREARREAQAQEREALRWADSRYMTDSAFRAEVRGLAARAYDGEARLRGLNRDLLRAQKWAKGRRGWKTRHATLKARRAYVRAALADLGRAQARAACRAETRDAIQALRAMQGPFRPEGFQIARNNYIARAADPWTGPDAAAETWQQEQGERAAILAAMALRVLVNSWAGMAPALRERIKAASDAAEGPAAEAQGLRDARIAAAREARAAERLAREREARESWLRGDPGARFHGSDAHGGAYLRAVDVTRDESGEITGGMLETSQGARVPLPHAIRVFRFLKWCRETGRAWDRNGRTLRVGYYQVDRVEADGSFRAGCHNIRWEQVARLAMRLDVADLSGADVTEPKGVAA